MPLVRTTHSQPKLPNGIGGEIHRLLDVLVFQIEADGLDLRLGTHQHVVRLDEYDEIRVLNNCVPIQIRRAA